jgi:hypothetical protein
MPEGTSTIPLGLLRGHQGANLNYESKYLVVLLDDDGYELSERPAQNLKEAKQEMGYMLSDAYAQAAETTHEKMGTHKVEVRNAKGECIFDKHYADCSLQS